MVSVAWGGWSELTRGMGVDRGITISSSASSSISFMASSSANDARLSTDGPNVFDTRYSATDKGGSLWEVGGVDSAELKDCLSGLDRVDEKPLPSGVTGLKLSATDDVLPR